MEDTMYDNVVKRWQEVTTLPPQKLGKFTPFYKEVTKRLKVMPWFLLVLLSGVIVLGLYFIFGPAITWLVTILQRGF